MNIVSRSRISWLAAVLAVTMPVLLTGCRSYQLGTIAHPELNTIAIGQITNATDEPALAVLLRQKLAEHVVRDGSLKLASADKADVILTGTIQRYRTRRGAAAKVREEDIIPEDRSTFRTTVYDVRVDVEYSLNLTGDDGRTVLAERNAIGTASFPALPDHNITRQSGFQQALNDAAMKMVASITEAW